MQTLEDALRAALLREGRRLFTPWRAHLVWYRATRDLTRLERRWGSSPDRHEVAAIIRRLEQKQAVTPLPNTPSVYRFIDPAFPSHEPSAHEVLAELCPGGVLSYESAYVARDLTLTFPQTIHMSNDGPGLTLLPPGVDQGDFYVMEKVPCSKVPEANGRKVLWHSEKKATLEFSRAIQTEGAWVRVASLEKCLVDGLRKPDWCGGFARVLNAWVQEEDAINVDALVEYTDFWGSQILRQRVGYLAEGFGITHPTFDSWRQNAVRGGSAKLVASESWSGDWSERWTLGINADVEALIQGGDFEES